MLNFIDRLRITGSVRRDWYLVMAKTAEAGLPQTDVLEKLRQNFARTKHPLGKLINEMLMRLRGGGVSKRSGQRTIGTELAGLVPEEESLMIQAGEESGEISEGFANAAEFVVAKGQLQGAIIESLTKPVIYFMALIGLFLFFSFKLLPSFGKFRPRHLWPTEAQALGWLADHIIPIVGSLIGLVVGGIILVTYLSRNWITNSRDFADRHLPPFSVIAQMRGATFIGALAGYISAGIPFSDAIASIKRGGNVYTRHQCDRIQNGLRNGKLPAECLVSLPMIHVSYHWIIDVYGMAHDESEAYKTISREMLDRTIKMITLVFGGIISNLFLALMAGCIMWIYFSMFAIADIKT